MVLTLNKEKIARCFRRSLPSYDAAALVQNDLAARLLQGIDGLSPDAFRRVLEVGCCTGVLSEMLCANKPLQTLYLNDLVPDFEAGVFTRLSKYTATRLVSHFGDIEALPLPSDLSLVVSGATFQWLSDLPAFITRLGCELQRGSYLAFSLFGPGTLKEFSALTAVQLQYYSDQEVLSFLEGDFIVESYQSYEDRLYFSSVREILTHIRDTGVGGVAEYQWNKESLRRFEEHYRAEFGDENGLPVSYCSSCYVARRR